MKICIFFTKNKQLFVTFFFSLVLFCFFKPTSALASGDASFSLSPASGNYNVSDTINISINETSTSGDNVNAVEADLSYNASQLQYDNTSLTGPFTLCAKNSGGGGSVNIACASSSTVNGTQSIATITFTVLSTGSTTINMASTSDIDNNVGTSVFDGTQPSSSFNLSSSSGSSSSSSSSGGGGNNSTSNTCTQQAPSSAPNLYEIDVTSTTATIFFSPAGSPYDSHFISYGQGNSSEGYGINFPTSQSSGALYYTVRQLSPSTVYTFKVRGGNGCKPGPWSGTITVLTLSQGATSNKQYFSNQQAPLVQSTLTGWFQQAANFVTDHLPGVPDTGLGAPKKHMKVTPTTSSEKANANSSSLWGSVVTFFSNIFHTL